jgi:hypothetical protein
VIKDLDDFNKTGKLRNFEAHLCNDCFRRKAKSITYSVRAFVGLVIQHAKRVRPIILSFVACLALSHFSTLYNKLHDIRKSKISEHKMCFYCLYRVCLKHFTIQEEFSRILS